VAEEHEQNAPSRREHDLLRLRGWFAPALQSNEVLRAGLAATPFRLTMLNSLVGTAKEMVGHNQGRVLLLTDRAIHVAGRKFWRRRFRVVLATIPVGTVPVSWDGRSLVIGDTRYYLNPAGFQLGGVVGTSVDLDMFLAAGSN